MNWKGLKGLVLLLSITLASPSSSVHAAAAQRSSQKQRTDSSQKFSSKGHSSLTAFPSSELYESGTKRDHQTADSKETPLIRLKRIKRQTESSSSSSSSAQRSTSSNWPGRTPINAEPEVLKIHDKIGARPTNAVSSDRRKFPASHSGAYRDSTTGSRVHTKMLRKKETANRNSNRGGGKGHGQGKVPTRKSNEISDPVQTAAASAIGHHHKTMPGTGGGGGYFHHRNEQSRLESAAEFALRQRSPHKKTKRLKNRSELDLLKAGGGRTGHAPPPQPLSRPRPAEEAGAFGGGQQGSRYHDAAMVKARGGGGRGHAVPVKAGHGDDHGGGGGEASHRSRRGQRSGATAVNGGGGGGHGQGQKVRAELEHIKRMQRDLMKEISHLEHMKKKKKVQRRSASSSSSHSFSSSIIHQQNHRQQIAKAHRK